MSGDEICTFHSWDLGYHSGIDLCRNCPAKRMGTPKSGEFVIEYNQNKPYGYSGEWSR